MSDWFSPLSDEDKNSEFIALESKTFVREAMERFLKNKMAVVGFLLLLLFAVFAIFGPFFSPYEYDAQDTSNAYAASSVEHILGTDKFGRDVFVRLCYGARISLSIGFGAAIINSVIGVVIGGLCGYLGGKFDSVVMRIVDIIYAMPSMLYVILIMMLNGANVQSILIGVCIPGWIGMARQVRGQVIGLKEQEFALAALVLGASDKRILFKHLIINAIGPIIVQMTLLVPSAIFTEAFLSFIGIGISAPMASWGSMAQDARQVITLHPVQMLLPTLCICLTIFSLNFFGEGIGDAFNPKKK
ncbi:MAG: ABC transporter permease [Butyrivibrio sp.]|nr:ABC transporter permease [Muribaculum sp.]MCM1551252.1 ABC transporter permease [Butyrivibrio sp.]